MSQHEEWRPIPGWPDYRVSDQGRVLSLKKKQAPIVLRPGVASNGYYTVCLQGVGERRTRTVHSLVAEAFHGPCPVDGYEVRHLNGQKLDCRAENLLWGSRSQNEFDKVQHGTHYWANRTHCKQGHPWDERNTRRNAVQRICRTCSNAASRAYKQRARLAAANVRPSAAA